ncbi:recombinase family protein [Neobacillus drentensis]|uniref:recombinase family protein n=1 Tax=Neobacillus drentensis TaxID=220684 RepID=UPI002858DB9F|nr:recombinase family protein [Neobacillus drentensis]MDR7237176.1 DNA invertase Pin-like site-specific DNA recombinase [Neobacillus drentensis]
MKCAIYKRVSTKLQETKFSLGAQTTELRKYALSQGWKIIDEFIDVDTGGKLDKKGLNALLDVVEEGRIDVVLVVEQDRLSRLDTIAWEYLKDTLRENKVKIAEPGHIVDLANEDEEFISDIKNLIARRQKKSVVRSMMRGKRQRMREGKGWGKAPFEYYYDKREGAYKLDDNWSWVIPFIDDLYLNKQIGMVTIANMLNGICKTPTGNLWNEHLICTRLTTKAYHGVMEKTFATGETIKVEDMYPALRTKETWEKLQEERIKRGEQYKATSRQRDNLHILRRTIITCGECGRKIHLAMHGTRETPRYYLKHGRKLKLKDETICDISINTVRIEGNIIKAIKDILTNKDLAKNYMDAGNDKSEINFIQKQLVKNEKTINSMQSKLDKLLDLLLDGRLKKEALIKKQTEIEDELAVITKQNDQQKAKLEMLKKSESSHDYIYELLEIAEGFETELTPAERAQVMGNLFPKAIIYKDYLLLKAEFKGVPLDLKIPVAEDPYPQHFTKVNKI